MSRSFPWRAGMRGTIRLARRVDHADGPTFEDGGTIGFTVRPWRTGVGLCATDDRGWAVACWETAGTPVDCGATRGALLEAVREVWADPSVYLAPTALLRPDGTSPAWFVYTGAGRGPIGRGPTEFAALLAAYEAAPAPRSTT